MVREMTLDEQWRDWRLRLVVPVLGVLASGFVGGWHMSSDQGWLAVLWLTGAGLWALLLRLRWRDQPDAGQP